MQEERAGKLEKLQELYDKLEGEKRAITEEEQQQAEELQNEIDQIDKTIKVLSDIKEKLAEKSNGEGSSGNDNKGNEERAEAETEAFEKYLRDGIVEERADTNMTYGDNGAVIPETIADKIVKKVYDISPVLEKATRYNVKGALSIPYYPDDAADSTDITMAYQTEFSELESTAGKFKSIELKGFLAGVLSLVSKSLINNSKFDIVSFVIDQMAYNISRWVEGELIKGTTNKISGLSGVTQKITAASATAITADELIELQDSVKDAFQQNAIWIMSPKTRTELRKLKDSNGRYLLQDDVTAAFGKVMLGKPVFVSDNMPDMKAGANAVYYGDMSGLAVKISEELEIQVLREKYATQHAIGVVGWMELDAKIENAQKISVLTMKPATAG